MKNLYDSALCKDRFDVIVIGSGIGGLTAAVCLAKGGKKVLVLERHYEAGGFSHTFKRKKYEWDVGVHYVGRVGDPGSLMRKAFDYVTDAQLQWASMGDVYDKAIIAGDEYEFVVGIENQILKMIGYFPDEETAIRKYYSLVVKTAGQSTAFFSERSMPAFVSAIFGKMMKKGFLKYADRSTYDVLRELTSNEKLIAVLCAQCGNYGLPPRKSSFAIHAVVVDHYLEGASYPVGGASNIQRFMTDVLEKNGGRISLKAEVRKIILDKEKAIGVEMMNGDRILCSQVLSNAGVHNTFNSLVTEASASLCSSLNAIRSSTAHVCLYLGLDLSDKDLNLPRHNFWIYDEYGFDEGYEKHLTEYGSKLPLVYISFPSAKDPEWAPAHPSMSTIQVMTACPYEWVEKWEASRWQKRDGAYGAFKEQYVKQLLEKLYSVIPQAKGHIVQQELSSPLTTRHFSNYSRGEIYGMEHTPLRFRNKSLRADTPYKNLFLAGQDIITVGVGGALFSGVIASTRMLNRNMLWRIHRYKQKDQTGGKA